jgi:hypothetical protein
VPSEHDGTVPGKHDGHHSSDYVDNQAHKCSTICVEPYVLNETDCACNGNLLVTPSACKQGFIPDKDLCSCISYTHPSYYYVCNYGFTLNLDTCQCVGHATCSSFTACGEYERFDLSTCACIASEDKHCAHN